MHPHQVFILRIATSLLVATIVGMMLRGRHRLCWSFLAYCTATAIGGFCIATWQATFWTQGFFMFKEIVYSVLKTAVAIEISVRTFRGFQVAGRRAAVLVVLALGIPAYTIAAGPEIETYRQYQGLLQSIWQVGIVYLFLVPMAVARLHSVPIHPFHFDVALGFGVYLGVYATLLKLVGEHGLTMYAYLAALDPAFYVATIGVWCFGAWRRPGLAEEHYEAMQRLAGRLRVQLGVA